MTETMTDVHFDWTVMFTGIARTAFEDLHAVAPELATRHAVSPQLY